MQTVDSPIRPVDQLVLDLLRREPGLAVSTLMERLEVTATAIRQRLDRLEEAGYIERKKQGEGRGRPTFYYYLTDRGAQHAGVTYSDLAIAMWNEVNSLEDSEIKSQLLDRVSHRMGKSFNELLSEGSLEDRMRDMAGVLAGKRIPTTFGTAYGLPVIEVHACPYPDLAGSANDRTVCDLEQRMMSEALGQTIELSLCRLDGHGCCQFKPVTTDCRNHEHPQTH